MDREAPAGRSPDRDGVTPVRKMPRVILIGGTSHTGKTTLARSMATALGWRHISTDSLARHPGRPWRTPSRPVPARVREHYLQLSADELIADVLKHYKGLWPVIGTIVRERVSDGALRPLILEGSAIWPDRVPEIETTRISAFWLTGDCALLATRIRAASGHAQSDGDEREMIDKFIGRTVRFNEVMMESVRRHGLPSLDVAGYTSVEVLRERCLAMVAAGPPGG